MIAAAKNYDVLCFQLRNNLYSHLGNSLKKDLNRLSADIKLIITSENDISIQSTLILSQVFNLRIKAIKWLTKDMNFDYMEKLKEILPQIEELRANKKLEILIDNLLFALRCKKRVIESVSVPRSVQGRRRVDDSAVEFDLKQDSGQNTRSSIRSSRQPLAVIPGAVVPVLGPLCLLSVGRGVWIP
jgi:hypothetical protein